MARIIPFKGILYNQDKIEKIADVVAPPYDVISDDKQRELHERHENNVIKLILGLDQDGDTKENNRHTRAAGFFNKWIADDVLATDSSDTLYLTSLDFSSGGKVVTRYGLITQVGLEPFENGIILPHEQTFSAVKSERLELLKICKANFSQIFSIYSDQNDILITLVKAVADVEPDIDLVDDVDERHKLWRITDKSVLDLIRKKMSDQKLFIADGHHRYETALNYRKFLKDTDPDFSDSHPANNIMMYLCSMEDPGLIIYPTHRLLNSADEKALSSLLENATAFFDITERKFDQNYEEVFEDFRKDLADDQDGIKIGVVIKEKSALYVFKLKNSVLETTLASIPEALRNLDVTILTNLIFIELLGLTQDSLDKEKLITYTENDAHAVEAVVTGDCDVAFILNSTKIKQVQDIAESDQTMPRKTTYFYPKALTGLVFNKLSD